MSENARDVRITGRTGRQEDGVSWNIRVSHEENDGTVRLIVEAGVDVPEEVISTVAGSYWLEEVQQYDEGPWDEDEMPSGGGMHG